jgi:hypothetical protein
MTNGKAELIKLVGKKNAERYIQICKTIMKHESQGIQQPAVKA